MGLRLALIVGALFGLQLWQVWHTGVTADEPTHILGSHFYWVSPKTYHVSDLAPALKIATGWAGRWFAIPLPDDPRWKAMSEWQVANAYFVDLKDPFLSQLSAAFRLPVLVFPLLTVLALFHWARSEAGPAAALVAVAAFAFEPTALAHGSLVKNDVAAALAYLLFWYAGWRYFQQPSTGNAAALTASAALGVLTKLSLVILGPIGAALLLARPRRAWLHAPLFLTGLYAGLCAGYQWDTRVLHPLEIQNRFADPGVPYLFTWTAQIFQWLPVPTYFWEGCVSLFQSAENRPPIYLLGQAHTAAQWHYFLVALAVKVPVGLQAAILLGAVSVLYRRPKSTFFLLFPPLLYIGLASMSGHQLGIRLILPALPFGALLAAHLARHHIRAAVLLTALGCVESLARYPHGIAFFNLWAGGPENGLRYLADSNLDWGQDLPALRAWATANKIERLNLSYFGGDTPWRLFSDTEVLHVPPPWSEAHTKGRTELPPEPGVYAISASLLPGQYFDPKFRNYYRHFRDRQPTARAGWSIYIYDLRR